MVSALATAGYSRGSRKPVRPRAGRVCAVAVTRVPGSAARGRVHGRVDRWPPPMRERSRSWAPPGPSGSAARWRRRHAPARHHRAGVGTAYVRDRAGADVVVDVTASGTVRRFAAGGEATHPALSAAGDLAWAVGGDLRLVRAGGSRGPASSAGRYREGWPSRRCSEAPRRSLRPSPPRRRGVSRGRIPEQPVALLPAPRARGRADAFHGWRRPVVRRADTGRAARRRDRVRPGHGTGLGGHAADYQLWRLNTARRAPGPGTPR